MAEVPAVEVKNFNFRYNDGVNGRGPFVLENISLSIPKGRRCLLVGGNGAGKSTLLRCIGGMHMLFPPESVLVAGRDAFSDRKLNSIRVLMQTDWATRSVAFAGYNIPLSGDFPVCEMNKQWQDAYPDRRDELLALLGIDPEWRMNRLSEGQRRRVQLFTNMLRPFEVLLLDEVLSVLDVVVRQDVLAYLKKECETRGATIIYATHIFDGLFEWPTDLIYIKRGGRVGYQGPFSPENIPLLNELRERNEASPLLRLVEIWLRSEMKSAGLKHTEVEKEGGEMAQAEYNALMNPQNLGGGYTSGRLLLNLTSE